MPENLAAVADVPKYTGLAEPLQGEDSDPPVVRGGIAVVACAGIGQLQPAAAWLPVCPDPPFTGIMVAPAGTPNAVPGDAAIANTRKTTAHALFRIMILIVFTIVTS